MREEDFLWFEIGWEPRYRRRFHIQEALKFLFTGRLTIRLRPHEAKQVAWAIQTKQPLNEN